MSEISLITQQHLGFEQKAKLAEDRALDLLMEGQRERPPLGDGGAAVWTDQTANVAEAQAWATLALSLRTAAQAETLHESIMVAGGQT
jgi:hypothetical protein